MADSILDLAEQLWAGNIAIEAAHPLVDPLRTSGAYEEVAPDTLFMATLANISAFRTADGLVLVDTGLSFLARMHHERLRTWDASRLNTAVYSHGHIDHIFGVPPFDEEARANGWPAPHVIAHEAMPARFDRYILTAGYNSIVNQRQFGFPQPVPWPTSFRDPDEVYRDVLSVEVGGELFELHHARGETDDHTWTWVPGRKVLCSGDMFIWATPNCGNPQKVQRYPADWARALREMIALDAEVLLPGHGFPILGADRIRQALGDTADLLENLHDRTVAMMNAGEPLDRILHEVRPPQDLIEKPYLRPVYDDPEFIVRNIWREYGGWYDGNPAHLKPARDADLASEVAALSGGASRLAERARALAAEGKLRLAAHLAEMASGAAPDDRDVHAARAEVFEKFAESEPSVMAKGIYRWAAKESAAMLDSGTNESTGP
jgi:alkyl sulfatase BDS1-like metallo-beta-lactamase superfamily hydrolase